MFGRTKKGRTGLIGIAADPCKRRRIRPDPREERPDDASRGPGARAVRGPGTAEPPWPLGWTGASHHL
jgi:hypothetical protein